MNTNYLLFKVIVTVIMFAQIALAVEFIDPWIPFLLSLLLSVFMWVLVMTGEES